MDMQVSRWFVAQTKILLRISRTQKFYSRSTKGKPTFFTLKPAIDTFISNNAKPRLWSCRSRRAVVKRNTRLLRHSALFPKCSRYQSPLRMSWRNSYIWKILTTKTVGKKRLSSSYLAFRDLESLLGNSALLNRPWNSKFFLAVDGAIRLTVQERAAHTHTKYV